MNLFKPFRSKHKNTHKNNEKKSTKSLGGLTPAFFPSFKILVFIFLIIDLYLIASIFSFSTGAWGKAISEVLIGTAGGVSFLVLLYIAYLCVAFLLSREITHPLSQVSGTVFLVLSTSTLLGLFKVLDIDLGLSLFRPGATGLFLARFLLERTGTLGSILFAFTLGTLSATLYGFVKTEFIREKSMKLVNMAKKMTTPATGKFNKRKGSEIPPEKQEEEKLSDARKIENKRSESKPVMEPVQKKVPLDIKSDSTGIPEDSDLFLIAEKGEYPEPEIPGSEEQSEPEIEPGHFPPPLDIFGPDDYSSHDFDRELIADQGEQIITTLEQFGIEAELAETVIGPTVIQFQIQLSPGIKVSRVAGLSNDLAVALAVPSLRVEAPIPFKPYVGLEIPNPQRSAVPIRALLGSDEFTETDHVLPLISGLRVNSKPLIINLEELPHLLVAGTTGSGKSVFINSCITGLCSTRKPEEMRLLLIDPKRVELSIYEKLPHVLAKPVVDPRKAVHALGWAVREMEHRYEVFARSRVKNLTSYNSKTLPKDRMPRIVIIVDELADLMFTAQKEVEDFICRLAQMARATGIHLIIATQRPSVNVITGLIKANIPARVAFTLPSQADSRTIIDLAGAEKLLGKGDMLFVSSKYPRPLRVQAPFMEESHSIRFINYMKDLFGEPEYVDLEDQGDRESSNQAANLDDSLLEEAIHIVLNTGIASASRLQRQLRIGFTRAARLIDTMEDMGIVGPPEGSKPRDILVDEETANNILEESMKRG
jgi:S-DNA-T family DNA segregation ATPase FtsK/SpoIIIE